MNLNRFKELLVKEASNGRYVFSFFYYPSFIEKLKMTVPFKDREYNERTHEWTISKDFYERAVNVAQKYFDKITIEIETPEGTALIDVSSGREIVQRDLFKCSPNDLHDKEQKKNRENKTEPQHNSLFSLTPHRR
ncbi:MAG: hypothetical protein DDT19_00571 [Syntrophomonadaceae bacterium]|nr:hypothetical protein [Bacillota bacterium]